MTPPLNQKSDEALKNTITVDCTIEMIHHEVAAFLIFHLGGYDLQFVLIVLLRKGYEHITNHSIGN